MHHSRYGGFPKLGVPFYGIPIIRIIVFGVYIGVPLFWETTIWIVGNNVGKCVGVSTLC